MAQLGSLLQEAREEKGLSLEEAEEATRIRRKYLSAFEAGDYAELPPAVYTRGLLRSYARYLGLDAEEALTLYSQEAKALPGQAQRGPTFMSEPLATRRRLDPELLVGLVILVAIVAALAWVVHDYILPLAQERISLPVSIETPTGVAVVSTVPPTTVATPTVAPAVTVVPASSPTIVAREIELRLTLTSGTFVQVRVDGQVAFEGNLAQGDSRTWVAHQAVALRANDGSALTVTVNGRAEGPLGAPGQAVNLVWVLGPDGKPVRLTVPGSEG